MKKTVFMDFALPALIALGSTTLIALTNADIELEKLFHSPSQGWFMGKEILWNFLYHYGNLPAILLAGAGFITLVLGFFQKKLRGYRKIGLFLLLFVVMGPGILVNTILKDNWGRPRPADIVTFGGQETFHQIWEKGSPSQGKSFPSGHAAIGFALFAPFFFLRHSSPKGARFFLCLGIAYGSLMGAGRMIQGGHYLSDILWSGVCTYLTGLTLAYLFRFHEERE